MSQPCIARREGHCGGREHVAHLKACKSITIVLSFFYFSSILTETGKKCTGNASQSSLFHVRVSCHAQRGIKLPQLFRCLTAVLKLLSQQALVLTREYFFKYFSKQTVLPINQGSKGKNKVCIVQWRKTDYWLMMMVVETEVEAFISQCLTRLGLHLLELQNLLQF